MGDWNVSFSGENIFSFDNEPKSLPGFKSPGKVHGDGAKKKISSHTWVEAHGETVTEKKSRPPKGGSSPREKQKKKKKKIPRRDTVTENKISAGKGDAEGPGEVVYCMR